MTIIMNLFLWVQSQLISLIYKKSLILAKPSTTTNSKFEASLNVLLGLNCTLKQNVWEASYDASYEALNN